MLTLLNAAPDDVLSRTEVGEIIGPEFVAQTCNSPETCGAREVKCGTNAEEMK